VGILADFEYRTAEGHLSGVFVFERDALSTPSALPSAAELRPLESVPQAEPGAAADGRRLLGFWEFIAHCGGGRC
jgi:hypothetical protein